MTGRRSWIGVLFAASLLVSSAAEAQRVAVSYRPNFLTAVTQVVNLSTGVVESGEPRPTDGTPVFTSEGRFLLLRTTPLPATTPTLEIRDLVTGLRTSIDTPFVPRRAHPHRLAVYGLMSDGFARLDAAGARPYAACNGASVSEVELTLDGSRLVVLCATGIIETLDEHSGARLGVVVVGLTTGGRRFAINADGSQAIVARGAPGAATDLSLIDLSTGIEIRTIALSDPPPPPPFGGPGSGSIVAATPSRDAVVVTNSWSYDEGPGAPTLYYHRTQLLEFSTLMPLRQLGVPHSIASMAISPDGSRAFVASNHPRLFGQIQALDLHTGQPTAALDVVITTALGAAFPPLPPTLQATVLGQRVTLSWSLPAHSPAAQRFVIHAGSRSGASDLGTIDVGAGVSFLSVPAVPPGRYFLRMTAANVTGTSPPSAEVIIDVTNH